MFQHVHFSQRLNRYIKLTVHFQFAEENALLLRTAKSVALRRSVQIHENFHKYYRFTVFKIRMYSQSNKLPRELQ